MDQRRRVGSLIDGFGIPRWMYASRNVRVGGVVRQWPPPLPPMARLARPIYRVWWAWVVLGSVVVLLAGVSVVVGSAVVLVGVISCGERSESAPAVTRKFHTSASSTTPIASGSPSATSRPEV